MVPAAYVRMETLPQTPNGKLDRKALPAPASGAFSVREYEPPQTDTEIKVAAIWADVLKLDQVGRRDNFFELGGHSLMAVQVVTRLRQALSREVEIRDLFAHPELADLSQSLEAAAKVVLAPITRAARNRQPAATAVSQKGSNGHGNTARENGVARYDLESEKVVE
jgi:acyl carrier protein